MSRINKQTKRKTSYSIEAQAQSLFAFLKQTFFKMPKSIQVIGWLVFLLLFVFLVLYPILGVTYFQGKVIRLSINENGERVQGRERSLRIHKRTSTYTNDDGQFTLAVHVPNVPFMKVNIDFGEAEQHEEVSLPTPMPLLSLFNPNEQKIYYVPGSKEVNKFGVKKTFFLDEEEARKAFKSELAPNEEATEGNYFQEHPPAFQRSYMPGILYAYEKQNDEPKFTLRIKEIKVLNLKKPKEVYFDIQVEEQSMRFDNIPHKSSSKLDLLTIFPDMSIKHSDLDIQLSTTSHQVKITLFESKLFKDSIIGSVELNIEPDSVGKVLKQASDNLELTLELFPPVDIGYVTKPWSRGKNYLVALMLNTPLKYLEEIVEFKYELGSDFSRPYVTSPEVNKEDHYGYVISMYSPTIIKADVSFKGGCTIKLAKYIRFTERKPKSALDYYSMAKLYRIDNQHDKALDMLKKALKGFPNLSNEVNLPAFITLQAYVFIGLKRFEDANNAYERALKLNPRDSEVLNAYAYFLAERLPNPKESQLKKAKDLAENSISIRPNQYNLDTLGWIHFKLEEYDMALNKISRAKHLQENISEDSTAWQEITYHLGYVYLKLGRSSEAKTAFQEVVNYHEKFPNVSNEKLVQDSRLQLRMLNQEIILEL